MTEFLIAEDDEISGKLLVRLLAKYGRAEVAPNGKQALDMFKAAYLEGHRYEVVFLDIRMPLMDGQEVLTAIRDFESAQGVGALDSAKIIMTTAYGDSENVFAAHVGGCAAYLIKPITRQTLDRVVEALEVTEPVGRPSK